jgi:KDO2-lipid IV(A) lauroyltransferase
MQYLIEYILFRLACGIIKTLPVPFSIRMGRFIGLASSRLLRSRVKLAYANLQSAFGDGLTHQERMKIIRDLFSYLGEVFVESIIFSQKDVRENITIENLEYVNDALKLNKGVLIIGPHFGPWELASYSLGAHITGAATIYKPLKNRYINNYIVRTREKIVHLELISSKNALRPVLGKLRQGNAVVILFDQNAGKKGIPATFFGKTAMTYSTPAAFALQTGCPVIHAHIHNDSGFRKFRIIFAKPFPLINTGKREQDILANTQQYNDHLENLVRSDPARWFGWLHNRWKMPRRFNEATIEADL